MIQASALTRNEKSLIPGHFYGLALSSSPWRGDWIMEQVQVP